MNRGKLDLLPATPEYTRYDHLVSANTPSFYEPSSRQLSLVICDVVDILPASELTSTTRRVSFLYLLPEILVNMRIAGGLSVWILATSFLIKLSAGLTLTQECRCKELHPQQHYCEADYVILVTIVSETRCERELVAYHFQEQEVFKMTEEARKQLSINTLWTPVQDRECRPVLRRTQYVIAGKLINGVANLRKCHFVGEWRWLTEEQRQGFRGIYETGCQCEIKNKTEVILRENQCRWDNTVDCQRLYSYCVPTRPNGYECSWNKNANFDRCVKYNQRRNVLRPADQIPSFDYRRWNGAVGV